MPFIEWSLAVLIGAFLGYLTGYMKKKGENLATHEDINKLVDQVHVVTTTTKQIEAQISGDLWDRQKRWELRRDALFELTKRLGSLKDSLATLISAHQTDLKNGWQEDVNRTQNRINLGQEWLDAASALDNAILMAGVVCDQMFYQSVLRFSLEMREIARKAREWDAQTLANGTGVVGKQLALIMDEIRREIDRITEPKLQSSGSSAIHKP